ncbi:MAG: 50S ribosomal protein L25 [Saprospiraceae bacterium]
MQTIKVAGNARPAVGKKATKAVRNEGGIPCVIYGDAENIHFSTTHKDVKGLIYTPDFKVAEVSVDGVTHKCILKAAQFHPVKESILHLDFLKLEDGKPVVLEVPVRFKGASPGVKLGGALQQSLRRVKIRTTPENMVDELYGDISSLELGEAIRVRDIELPEGVEVTNAPAIPVATVIVPRALRGKDGGEGEEGEEEEA